MKKTLLLLVVTAIFCGVAINAAYAADNNTEFGIEDDLTVLGTGGSQTDPDAEIKGFTVFGATQTSYSPDIPIASGNVIINGYLGVSSGAYFVGGSTFSAGLYSSGISSFTAGPGSIYINGGNVNQVLKKDASGALTWANDESGASSVTGTPNRLQKIDNSGTGLVDAAIVQSGNGDGAGLTVVASSFSVNNVALFKSSVTINGDGTNGLNVAGGASTFAGDVTANASLNVGNGGGTDIMTVNGSGTAGTKFVVFQSAGSNVAWMRKK